MALNILIVDDSAVMRSMIIKTVKQTGLEIAEIHQAGNGAEGLQKIEKYRFDLIFIDVNMPVMDGMQMLARIRKNPVTKDIPVLIISTESNDERIKIILSHYAGFVHKPFTPEDLKAKILSILGAIH